MRKSIFLVAVVLVGCGDDFNEPATEQVQAQHTPEITNVVLTPATFTHMQGNGGVLVTAEISFRDNDLDIRSLWVQMPDGTATEFNKSANTQTGTFAQDLVMSTEKVGSFALEFWLVDDAGARSFNRRASFEVVWIAQSSDWTNRLSGLPHRLSDVVWNGSVFVAVGEGGEILTSADGIDWVAKDSGTDAYLSAVAAYGPDIFAVGDEIVLLSTDHGETWTAKDRPAAVNLTAVALNASHVVLGGYSPALAAAIIMLSTDRGDTWQAVDSWPAQNLHFADLVYRDGLFVAPMSGFTDPPGTWVSVSSDGETWAKISVSNDGTSSWGTPLLTIVHDESQFITSGLDGAVFASSDGFNWTQIQTPVQGAVYNSAVWNGSKLVLAGGSLCGMGICFGDPGVPHGIASTDGGVTWDIFNIDDDYVSLGLAWGNGRFVSVGFSTTVVPLEGAIYTTE